MQWRRGATSRASSRSTRCSPCRLRKSSRKPVAGGNRRCGASARRPISAMRSHSSCRRARATSPASASTAPAASGCISMSDTALITGGGGRIGRAVARRLVTDGWRVVLADRDGDAAAQAAAAAGGAASAITLDITKLADVRRAVGATVARTGGIAALINAAGGRTGAEAGPFVESDPGSWRAIVDLQLRGVIGCCYAVLPHMIAAKRGSIVSIAAVEGLRGDPSGAIFSTAKAGVIVLTETLVRELSPAGI